MKKRQRQKHRSDLQQAVLDAMDDAVLALDRNRHITLMNPAAAALLDLDETVIDQPMNELPTLQPLQDLVARCRPKQTISHEFELPGLPPRSVVARATVQKGGHGTVIVIDDVTELRRLERVRRDFVANVSHELRTPVSVILANAETLMDGRVTDGQIAQNFLGAIHRNAARLGALISDLLEIARIEAEEYPLAPQDLPLRPVVDRALEYIQPSATEKGQAVTRQVAKKLSVFADGKALDQVLFNLLDNAVKHTPAGTLLSITAWLDGPWVCVQIADDGPGLEAKHHHRIFERFYRADKGRSRGMGGTGLGLSIVKNLVEAMGGHVGVQSTQPHGCVFWFLLPRAKPA